MILLLIVLLISLMILLLIFVADVVVNLWAPQANIFLVYLRVISGKLNKHLDKIR